MTAQPRFIDSLPGSHRIARKLTAQGYRGATLYWRLAELIQSYPRAHFILTPEGTLLAFDPYEWTSLSAYHGAYERAELSIVQQFVRPGDVCVDIGANIGVWTAALAAWSSPKGTVFAFEPSPRVARSLEAVQTTCVGVELAIVRSAAGSETGSGVLRGADLTHHSGLGTLRPSEGHNDDVVVTVCRPDDVLLAAGIEHCRFVKIDVEGLEADVLRGLGGFLVNQRIDALLVEVSPAFRASAPLREALEALAPAYAPYRVIESGRLHRLPQLSPLSFSDIDRAPKQFNMLLVSPDAALPASVRIVSNDPPQPRSDD